MKLMYFSWKNLYQRLLVRKLYISNNAKENFQYLRDNTKETNTDFDDHIFGFIKAIWVFSINKE